MKQTFTIPGRFPGLNDFIKAMQKHRLVGAQMKAENTEVVRLLTRKLKPVGNAVFVTILWAEKDSKRDPDNVVFAKKFILDGLVEGGILPNDNRMWIIGFLESVMTDKDNPRIEVTLEEREVNMIEPRKGDGPITAHARRELEMGDAFTATEEYDGKIGRAVLDLVKSFERWCADDPAAMQVVANTFGLLIHGEILSEPTTDPDEWEAIEREDKTVWRNKRSPFYFSNDAGIRWYNVQTKEEGNSKNHITGEVPKDESKTTTDQATDEGVGTSEPTGNEAGTDQGSDQAKASDPGRRIDTGVGAEGKNHSRKSKKGKAKPSDRETK